MKVQEEEGGLLYIFQLVADETKIGESVQNKSYRHKADIDRHR